MKDTFLLFLENVGEPILLIKKQHITFANKAAREVMKITDVKDNLNVKCIIKNKTLLDFLSKGNFDKKNLKIISDNYTTSTIAYAEIDWYILPCPLHQNGNCKLLIGKTKTNTDIQMQLLDLRNDIKNILDCTPGKLYWKDTESRYVGANREWLELVGLSSIDQISGKRDEFFFGDQAELLRENDRWVMNTRKILVKEEAVQLSSGERRYFIATKMPRYDSIGNVIGIIGNSIDITDRKKMDEELKRAKEKAEEFNILREKFIQNMEHDLRTPLSGLESAISILSSQETNPENSKILKFALEETEEFKAIINAVLNFDHKRYNEPVINEPFRLSNIFHSVYVMNYLAANEKGLKLHYRLDQDIPSIIISDDERIKHILLNLIGNAIKFTEKGEVFFETKLIRKKNRHLLIEFIVTDTGIGIPKNKYNVIFERYVRLEPSNKGRYRGTGLGLANVKEYVDQLDGEFRPIQSEVGKGTTIAILIPMKESLDQDMVLPSDQKSKAEDIEFFHASATQRKKPKAQMLETKPVQEALQAKKTTAELHDKTTVLLVEDSPPAQFMGKIAIKGAGCEVDVAGTAEEALKMIAEKHYDLIFADIGLPGMDGIEMTRHIRYDQRKEGTPPTPIVGQSANASTKNKKACIEAGMQDLLAKPLTPTNVSDVLRNYTQHFAQTSAEPSTPKTLKNLTVIDFDALEALWKSKGKLRDILEQTQDATFKDIDDLKKAHDTKDWKRLLFLAHKIRGAFVYVAASRVEEACSYLEEYLSNTEKPKEKIVEPLYKMVVTELDTAWKALEKWVNS